MQPLTSSLPPHLEESLLQNPGQREFPPFDAARLLSTVFDPTEGCRVCILVDFEEPPALIRNFAFLEKEGFEVQKNAHRYFHQELHAGVMRKLGMSGGEMFAYRCTRGSNLDLEDEVWSTEGEQLSLDQHIYPAYDIILCVSTFSATAPLTAKCKEFGFRGATMHGMNEVILQSGLAVDYDEVSADAERMRLAMTGADKVEIRLLEDLACYRFEIFISNTQLLHYHVSRCTYAKPVDPDNSTVETCILVPKGTYTRLNSHTFFAVGREDTFAIVCRLAIEAFHAWY